MITLWTALALLAGAPTVDGWPEVETRVCRREVPPEPSGRYRRDPLSLVVVERRLGTLVLRPFHWQSPQILEPLSPRSYRARRTPERTARFACESGERVVEIQGFGDEDGLYRRVPAGERTALERLVGGDVEGARTLLAPVPSGATKAAALVLRARPSAAEAVVSLLEALPPEAREEDRPALLARAHLLAGRPNAARAVLARLGPASEEVSTLRERLEAPEGDLGLSFPLLALFAPPTATEIPLVLEVWSRRDLAPRGVEVVEELELEVAGAVRVARIIRHRVRGESHVGLVLVPTAAERGCCPGILEVRGVAWWYPALEIPDGLHLPDVLGELSRQTVLLVPGLSGETLSLPDRELASAGEPNDAFDGATDAALAFLAAAATVTPELDRDRICAFGKSRGGTVALLAGIRDPGIDCVVSWAAPVDWFRLMGKGGLSLEGLVGHALATGAPPSEGQGGQFVDWFLRSRDRSLSELRRWILASSPLHFGERLPPTQVHYGLEDRFVPAVNGEALADRMHAAGRAWPSFEAVFYEALGHDLDPLAAAARSREFLVRHLFEPTVAPTARMP